MVPRDPTATHDWLRLLSRLPWWLGVLGAILAYLALRGLASQAYAPGQTPGTGAGPLLRALAELGQWLLPAALLAVAAVTGYRRWRASLLHRELTADPVRTSLRDLSPSDFEALVAEVFRHQGYQVSEPVTRYSGGPREILLTRPDAPAIAPRRQASPRGTSPSLAVVPLPLPASHGTPTPSAVVHIRYWQAWRVGASRSPGADCRRGVERCQTRRPGRARRVQPRCAAYGREPPHRADRRRRPAHLDPDRSGGSLGSQLP